MRTTIKLAENLFDIGAAIEAIELSSCLQRLQHLNTPSTVPVVQSFQPVCWPVAVNTKHCISNTIWLCYNICLASRVCVPTRCSYMNEDSISYTFEASGQLHQFIFWNPRTTLSPRRHNFGPLPPGITRRRLFNPVPTFLLKPMVQYKVTNFKMSWYLETAACAFICIYHWIKPAMCETVVQYFQPGISDNLFKSSYINEFI